MLFSTGATVFDVDIEETKRLYSKRPYIWQQSSCVVCRMFEKNIVKTPKEELLFLSELGISCLKPDFVWACEPGNTEGTQFFLISYPISATPIAVDEHNNTGELREGLFASLEETENGTQLKLYWSLPWLCEKNK